jgi:hypothetical protein
MKTSMERLLSLGMGTVWGEGILSFIYTFWLAVLAKCLLWLLLIGENYAGTNNCLVSSLRFGSLELRGERQGRDEEFSMC